MKKMIGLLGFTIIAIISLLIVPINAENFWGVNKGDSRVYVMNETYTGNLTGSNEYPIFQYSILNNYNADAQNGTDLYINIRSLTPEYSYDLTTTKSSYSIMFQNESEPKYYNKFIFDDTDSFDTITSSAEDGAFLLSNNPGNYTATWFFIIWWIDVYGINWTRAAEQINNRSDLMEYNANWENNLMIINYTKENQTDLSINKNYTLHKRIVWDNETGFLVSFEMKKIYDDSFCTIKSTITSQTSYSQQPIIMLEIKEIFWPIGLIICSIAAILSLIVYSKKKEG